MDISPTRKFACCILYNAIRGERAAMMTRALGLIRVSSSEPSCVSRTRTGGVCWLVVLLVVVLQRDKALVRHPRLCDMQGVYCDGYFFFQGRNPTLARLEAGTTPPPCAQILLIIQHQGF